MRKPRSKSKTKKKSWNTPKSYSNKDTSYSKDYAASDDPTNNDRSWYTNNGQLISDAGTYSFNNAIGARIRNISVLPMSDEAYVDTSIPGIMTIRLLPSVGKSTDPYTPINVAARSIYDKVNYKNSRNFSYEAPDLMMYLGAIAAAYSYHAYLCRVYGVLNTFSQTNRYIPDALVRAMGVNPDNLRSQMADFRYFINYFARKVNTFVVPVGISYFEQAYWMYSNVYMDADSIKAQLYVYAPFAFWKYNETGTQYGGTLNPVTLTNAWTTGATFSDLVTMGNDLLEPLFRSQDINNISTDVMKAFENAVITLPDITSDYAVVPVYNPEVLTQIHNCYAVGNFALTQGRGSVTQDPNDGTLRYTLQTANVRAKLRAHCDVLIDLPMDNPKPDDVAVATRLHPIFNDDGTIESSNTFLPYDFMIWNFVGDLSGSWSVDKITFNSELINTAAVNAHISKFNDAPILYISNFSSTPESAANLNYEYIQGDLYNYTTIDKQDMVTLDEACLLSLFRQK